MGPDEVLLDYLEAAVNTSLVAKDSTQLLAHSSGGQKSNITGLKAKGWQDCTPLGALCR